MSTAARFNLKMDADEKAIVAKAAALMGTTMADLVRVAAKEKAQVFLDREARLTLTQGVGARRERTRPERFLNIELVMPTLSDQLRIIEVLKRQTPLKAKHSAIRQANAALLPATLERVFAASAAA